MNLIFSDVTVIFQEHISFFETEAIDRALSRKFSSKEIDEFCRADGSSKWVSLPVFEDFRRILKIYNF